MLPLQLLPLLPPQLPLLLLLLCVLLLLLDLRLLFAVNCTRGEEVRFAASFDRVTRVVVVVVVVVAVATIVADGLLAISLLPLPLPPPPLGDSSLRTDCRVPVAGEAEVLVNFSLGLGGSAVSAGAILLMGRYCQIASCITSFGHLW